MKMIVKVCWVVATMVALMSSARAEHWLTVHNTPGPVRIRLKEVPASVNGNNMSVTCFTDAVGACVMTGGRISATATLTCSNCGSVRAGGSVNLSWSSTEAVVCYVDSTGPTSVPNWTGVHVAPAGARSVTLPRAGLYQLTLACYGDGPWSGIKVVNVTVAP